MTLLRNDGRLIFLAHIPKTGGSSIEYALRTAGAARALHFHKRMDYAKCNLQHMHAELYQKFVPSDFYDYGLAVTRHPFDRLLSEYKWRIQLGHANLDFDPWVIRHLELYQRQPYVLDNHIRPQNEFLCPSIEVFRFEDGLDAPLRSAAKHLGLSDIDTSTHRRQGDPIGVTWSDDTRQRVFEFYRSDFELLGYDPSRYSAEIRLE
jgi:hypothetical protein